MVIKYLSDNERSLGELGVYTRTLV